MFCVSFLTFYLKIGNTFELEDFLATPFERSKCDLVFLFLHNSHFVASAKTHMLLKFLTFHEAKLQMSFVLSAHKHTLTENNDPSFWALARIFQHHGDGISNPIPLKSLLKRKQATRGNKQKGEYSIFFLSFSFCLSFKGDETGVQLCPCMVFIFMRLAPVRFASQQHI